LRGGEKLTMPMIKKVAERIVMNPITNTLIGLVGTVEGLRHVTMPNSMNTVQFLLGVANLDGSGIATGLAFTGGILVTVGSTALLYNGLTDLRALIPM